MRTLAQFSETGLDVSSELAIVEYTADAPVYLSISLTVDNLSGTGGAYRFRLYLGDAVFIPDYDISVAAGLQKVALQSKNILMNSGNVATLSILGQPGDTAVDVSGLVIDIAPVTSTDVVDIIGEDIEDTIVNSLEDHEINVYPQRVILGKCRTPLTRMPVPLDRNVVSMPVVR